MDFKQFLQMVNEAESTAEKDDKAEKAGKKVAKDIEYDEGHKGKDDKKAEKAGEKVKKDIEYDDKKDKKSLKDWFEIIDKNMLAEAEQITMEPAKQNTQVIKQGTKTLGTVSNPALAAQIKQSIGKGEMSLAGHDMKEEAEDNPESAMMEKWAGDAEVKPTGQYKDKTKEELKSMLAKLHKSGPHDKDSPAAKKMRQINFALRAKGGWKSGEGAAMKEESMDESGLQAYLGKKKYGPEGMKALQKAGREGASKEKMAQIRAKHDKLDEVQVDENLAWRMQQKRIKQQGDIEHKRKYKELEALGLSPEEISKELIPANREPGWVSKVPAKKVDERAKNPYAIGMAQAMKSAGDKPPLKKSTITKAHDIAKSIKKKTDEAEIPHSGPDYGAGLGAGRSQSTFEGKKPDFLDLDKDGNKKESMKKAAADKKKKKVDEAMNTLEAAYHEGKSHGLTKHGYACRYDEGTDEHRRYHEGFKEGLDECYGLMPVQGLVVGETMPAATVPGMASQAMPAMEDLSKVGISDELAAKKIAQKIMGTPNLNVNNIKQYVTRYLDMVGKASTDVDHIAALVHSELDSKGLIEADMEEGNAFTAALARTPKGGKFSVGGKTFTDRSDYNSQIDEFAFESLDKQLNDLLNEGVSVNMQKDIQGLGDDSVSVTATDDDAAKLLDFIKQVGLGGLGDDKAEVGSVEPIAAVSDYGAPKFSGHDDMMGLIKVASGEDYKDEESHERNHAHEAKMCETHGMEEAKCGCGEGKEMVDEVESEDQMLYNVAEDDGEGYEQSQAAGAEIDSALAGAMGGDDVKVSEGGDGGEASEEPMMSEESKSEEDDHAEKAGRKVAKDIEHDEGHKGKDDNKAEKAGKEVTKDIEYDDKKDQEKKLDEWANDAGKDGTDQAFQRDIEFMTKVIAGGLNKPKSTGQQTIPVLAGDKARTGIDDELIAEWKKLSGLR